jgi:hypothetical protein
LEEAGHSGEVIGQQSLSLSMGVAILQRIAHVDGYLRFYSDQDGPSMYGYKPYLMRINVYVHMVLLKEYNMRGRLPVRHAINVPGRSIVGYCYYDG